MPGPDRKRPHDTTRSRPRPESRDPRAPGEKRAAPARGDAARKPDPRARRDRPDPRDSGEKRFAPAPRDAARKPDPRARRDRPDPRDSGEKRFTPAPRDAGPARTPHREGPPPRERRALSNLGGPIEVEGDPAIARLLREAMDVAASDEPPPLTHGFHTYPARFHPLLVRRLLAAHPSARRVLDPFCGSGTTLVEAALAGRAGYGVDVNPLAVRLSRLKATTADTATLDAIARAATQVVARAGEAVRASRRRSAVSAPPARETRFDDPRFYPPHVYRELVTLRLAIDAVAPGPTGDEPVGPGPASDDSPPPTEAHAPRARRGPRRERAEPIAAAVREALLFVLSSLVVKFSFQRSETAEGEKERHIARGAPTRLFADRALDLVTRLAAFSEAVPAGTPAPTVKLGDARDLRPRANGSIDLVITSPPYLGTYDYASHHARRFGWLGVSAQESKALLSREIGARRDAEARTPGSALARFEDEVRGYAAEIARLLAPGAFAFVLVGDSSVGDRPVPGDDALRRAAARVGLEIAARASQSRPEVYLRGMGQREGGRREHLMALRHA